MTAHIPENTIMANNTMPPRDPNDDDDDPEDEDGEAEPTTTSRRSSENPTNSRPAARASRVGAQRVPGEAPFAQKSDLLATGMW